MQKLEINSINHFNPKVIFEIGVGNPSICRTTPFFNRSGVRVEMFEANPNTYNDLIRTFGFIGNATIRNLALYDKDSIIEFSVDGDSSYISEVVSPTIHNAPKEYIESRQKITVQAKTLAEFDKGDIDLILIDTEGCEYKIISTMISRPKLVVVETHNETYRTPHLDLLEDWFQKNDYSLVRKEITDSWYVKNDI